MDALASDISKFGIETWMGGKVAGRAKQVYNSIGSRIAASNARVAAANARLGRS